jgi:hypothetical protein
VIEVETRDLHHFCLNKLSTRLREGGRHEVFVPVYQDEPIKLIHTISLSRGTGAVSRNNQKSIADAMFMSLSELNDASTCGIGPAAAYLGMCVRVLWLAKLAISEDPITFPWNHPAIALVGPLLRIAERERARKRGRNDPRFLGKLLDRLHMLRGDMRGELLNATDRVLVVIRTHLPN